MNGARGAVESFSPEGYPVVRFLGGKKEEVKLEKWQVKPMFFFNVTVKPLRARYAISTSDKFFNGWCLVEWTGAGASIRVLAASHSIFIQNLSYLLLINK